jgi:MarR family transcriptional regulator, organic hydroperoxide resistance regulator
MYSEVMRTSNDEQRPLTGALIWRLSLKWRVAVDRALAPIELTHAQYVFLGSLLSLSQVENRPSQQALAVFSGLEPMYVSKLARSMEQAGLVKREQNLADPRALHLQLTEQGKEVFEVAFARVSDLHNLLMAPLGESGDPRRLEFRLALEELLRHVDRLSEAGTEEKE